MLIGCSRFTVAIVDNHFQSMDKTDGGISPRCIISKHWYWHQYERKKIVTAWHVSSRTLLLLFTYHVPRTMNVQKLMVLLDSCSFFVAKISKIQKKFIEIYKFIVSIWTKNWLARFYLKMTAQLKQKRTEKSLCPFFFTQHLKIPSSLHDENREKQQNMCLIDTVYIYITFG